jgi:hypothetical protein
MSGLEIAGVILGSFPLIISSIENWNNMARIAGYYKNFHKEYKKCKNDARYHQLMYTNTLQELLLPTILAKTEMEDLINNPGGENWKTDQALQAKLKDRLHGSYDLYEDLIMRMNDVTKELAKELSLDKDAAQERLSSSNGVQQSPNPAKRASRDLLTGTRKSLNFQLFRAKFSLGEPTRDSLFARLKEYNERLQELVRSSDKLHALQSTAHRSMGSRSTELALKKICKSSDLLFRALQHAWQCSCSKSHIANLRIEHRTAKDICFELILMFTSPFEQCDNSSWVWQEVRCGQMPHCVHPYDVSSQSMPPVPLQNTPNVGNLSISDHTQTGAQKRPAIRFVDAPDTIRLCEGLSNDARKDCMGVVAHENVTYHLHPFIQRRQNETPARVTLDHILSDDWTTTVSRRQRFKIARLVASAVAQLTCTPWLGKKLEKSDVVFFTEANAGTNIQLEEPFIHQVFHGTSVAQVLPEASDITIPSLGILLVELCFGQRLEDCPIRKEYPTGEAGTKWCIDLVAAHKWSLLVHEEAGEDYANAVQWCFNIAAHMDKNWRSDIHRNVIQPLERCLAYFKIIGVSGT